MITVEIQYNTDETNAWVYDERLAAHKPLPMTCHGPFDTVEEAVKWMNAYPEDKDVYDIEVNENADYPRGWFLNDPESLWVAHEGREWFGFFSDEGLVLAKLVPEEQVAEFAQSVPEVIAFLLDG